MKLVVISFSRFRVGEFRIPCIIVLERASAVKNLVSIVIRRASASETGCDHVHALPRCECRIPGVV